MCAACGLLASDLEPSIPASAADSVINESDRQLGLNAVREANNQAILVSLLKARGGPGTLLDVGSGPGFLLRAAQALGFAAEGIEPDANVVQATRADGFRIRHGYFPDCVEDGETFDVVIFNDVLEHIPDAEAAVSAAAKHLSENGTLVLNCPDREGAIYRVADFLDRIGIRGPFDRMWQVGVPSPHRWYFKRDDLFAIGAKHGLVQDGSIRLDTLSLKGLRERIFHVRGQSRLMGSLAYAGAVAILPFLRVLPSDLGLAMMRKTRT